MAAPLSLVIASAAGGDFLFRCVESVSPQAEKLGAELIVVDRCGGAQRERLAREYPFVQLLGADPAERPGVPELRRRGVLQARGDIVAILEEHCVAPVGWLRAILKAFREGDAAIGGPILDDDYRRVRDWVVYFSEYHNFMPPWSEGERFQLNGANIAYDRAKLLRHAELLDEGYWEVVLHPRLSRDGALRAVPAMGVHHSGPFDYGYYLRQRYLLSRVWGGTQRRRVSRGRRLLYLVAAPLFPFLLLARIASRVLASGLYVKQFVKAVPLLVPVTLAYVGGEWLGYLVGAGHTLEQVE